MDILVIILIFGAIGYASWTSYSDPSGGPKETAQFKQVWSEVIEEMNLTVHFGDGVLNIDSGDAELVKGDLDYFNDQPEWEYSQEDTRGTLEITQDENQSSIITIPGVNRQTRTWNMRLHNEPLWTILINSGACDINSDLSDMHIRKLEINTGASDVEVKLGELQADSIVVVKAGASNIQLAFPERSGLKINLSGALSNDNLEEKGFTQEGNFYYSPTYDQAEFIYDVEISVGVSNVDVLFY
jgi:hypothetical protein